MAVIAQTLYRTETIDPNKLEVGDKLAFIQRSPFTEDAVLRLSVKRIGSRDIVFCRDNETLPTVRINKSHKEELANLCALDSDRVRAIRRRITITNILSSINMAGPEGVDDRLYNELLLWRQRDKDRVDKENPPTLDR